ncbi:hypothetical protein FEM48_Zijuj12G0124300 [Ziziphus jujuba var. spinosa]|uniref:Peptidase S26 domain-containing protein n=1 Tax=Ziziphus jujuba var. spinosa TaxID=714518 RepID=A0A978UDB5_ZIZJJ|nr:hypothetical protein FEM48_Zijuj12G0124300 [Ziziphus jujuba var. spinosa]
MKEQQQNCGNQQTCSLNSYAPKFVKLDFPRFNKEEEPTGWLCRIAQILQFHGTLQVDRVTLTSFYLESDAQTWYQILKQEAIVDETVGDLIMEEEEISEEKRVYGPSMLPTLNITGDVVLAEHVSHRFGKVGPGDLVLVRSPDDPRKTVTKRIVGVEGDKVTFLVPMSTHQYRTAVVPKGHVWIQGDNTYVSNDSRNFGPVPYGLIQGKVFFRFLRISPEFRYGLLIALDFWVNDQKEFYSSIKITEGLRNSNLFDSGYQNKL